MFFYFDLDEIKKGLIYVWTRFYTMRDVRLDKTFGKVFDFSVNSFMRPRILAFSHFETLTLLLYF